MLSFGWNMNYFGLSNLFNGIISIILGIFVLSKNPRDARYSTYFIFCLSVAVWSFCYFIWQMQNDPISALFWTRALNAGALFTSITYYHHISCFLGKAKDNRRSIIAGYVIAFLLLLLNFTPLYISGVAGRLDFVFWPVPGPLYWTFIAFWLVYIVIALKMILDEYKIAKGDHKISIKHIFVVTIIGWIGGAMNFPLWYNIPIYPATNILVSIYMVTIAYLITRYQLMDIKLIVRKGLLYSILTAIITFIYLSVVYLSETALKQIAGYNQLWLQIPVIFLLVLTFQPLKDKVQEKIDQIFFTEKEFFKKAIKVERRATVEKMRVSLQHEINNPLASAMANTQAMIIKLDKGETLSPLKLSEKLRVIEIEMKRIKGILLDLEKMADPVTTEYIPGVDMIDIKKSAKA